MILAVKDWFSWFDAPSVANNLVASAIVLAVGIPLTYFIVNILLDRRLRTGWQDTRDNLTSELKFQSEFAIYNWWLITGHDTDMDLEEMIQGIKNEFGHEWEAWPPDSTRERMKPELAFLGLLSSVAGFLDRARRIFADRPDILEALASLDRDTRLASRVPEGPGDISAMDAFIAINLLQKYIQLWNALPGESMFSRKISE